MAPRHDGNGEVSLSDGLPRVIVVRQGFAQSLLKRMSHRSTIPGCGVTFEIVSNIPGVSTRTWSRSAKKRSCQVSAPVKKKKSVNAAVNVASSCHHRTSTAQRTGRCWPDWPPAPRTTSQLTVKRPSRNTYAVSWLWRTSSPWTDSDKSANFSIRLKFLRRHHL